MLLFTLLLSFLCPSPQDSNDQIQIINIGCFHAVETNIDIELNWYALVRDDFQPDEYAMKKVELITSKCYDPIFGDDENSKSGARISISDSSQNPLLLIGGLKNINSETIEVQYLNFGNVYPGQTLTFATNPENIYKINGFGSAQQDSLMANYSVISDYKIILEKTKVYEKDIFVQQEIFVAETVYTSDEAMPSIAWAGDLDGDGKLDLIMNLTNHYNVSHLALYLSSSADEGQLVKLVAEWRTTGC